MNSISDVLNKFGIETVSIIKSNMESTGTNATGETSDSLRSEMPAENRVIVSGKPFLGVVETGRKAGKPPPISPIIKWLESGKFSFEGKIESVAYAISRKIGKEGSSLYRQGGRDDIIQPAISEARITALTNDIADVSLDLLVTTIDDFVNGS